MAEETTGIRGSSVSRCDTDVKEIATSTHNHNATLRTDILSHAIESAKRIPRRLERTQHKRNADGLVRLNVLLAKSEGYVKVSRSK